jgi:septum site-determining protein MinC
MTLPSSDPSSPERADATSAAMPRTPARPAAEFKGLSHPALRLVLNDPDDAAIVAALGELLGDGDAFEWQPVVVDAARVAAAEALDVDALVARLRAARLHPVAIAGANARLRERAEALQLGWLAALPERRGRGDAAAADAEPARSASDGTAADAGAAAMAEPAGAAAAEPKAAQPTPAEAPAPAAPPAIVGAMVVERPVRSGQQIYARERDLIVVGDVSPGAEVIADGHVHVYGRLAGRAIAGARGRRDAFIFTQELRAELVAVCGIYRTFEEGPPAAIAGKPVRISLEADADTLSMRPL